MGDHGVHRRGDGARAKRAGSAGRAGTHGRREPVDGFSMDEVRSALAARLRMRIPELEASIATRVYAIEDPRDVADGGYIRGLHAALAAAVAYAVDAVEMGERRLPDVPVPLLAQVRLAARSGVALDTVLRRCIAGNALLDDLIVAEAERGEVPSSALRRLLASQATLFERTLAAVSDEYTRETRNRPTGAAARRRECVKQLLAGELADHSELGYDLEAHHLAIVVKGEGGDEVIRELATKLGRRLLAVRHEEEPLWACWLGGRSQLAAERVLRALGDGVPAGVIVAVGEAGEGLGGWRFSHRQAKAALPVAERRGEAVLGYGEVALLATILGDELIATSLRQLYLAPLERARDGGAVAKRTLRAYFAAERNVSSTAAALGVDRRTVTNRIHAIEGLLGRPLQAAAADLEIALRLDD